jgi:hypothetical protein
MAAASFTSTPEKVLDIGRKSTKNIQFRPLLEQIGHRHDRIGGIVPHVLCKTVSRNECDEDAFPGSSCRLEQFHPVKQLHRLIFG